jgi:hypothetical protein
VRPSVRDHYQRTLQMTVIEIIDVVLVANGNMATSWTVHMDLIGGWPAYSFRACRDFTTHDWQRLRQD